LLSVGVLYKYHKFGCQLLRNKPFWANEIQQ
jgi:hypothetical protein